jgi:hypothetical protein
MHARLHTFTNVLKLLDDPPELVKVWQKISSVQLSVCLNEKSVTCIFPSKNVPTSLAFIPAHV